MGKRSVAASRIEDGTMGKRRGKDAYTRSRDAGIVGENDAFFFKKGDMALLLFLSRPQLLSLVHLLRYSSSLSPRLFFWACRRSELSESK